MRIGILTYHRAHNYGAMLQAYALRKYLLSLGHKTDFVDYWPEEHRKEYLPLRFPHCYTDIKTGVLDWIAWCMTPIRKSIRYYKFVQFRSQYLGLPVRARYVTDNQIIEEGYDAVIVGSDQIWRNYDSNHRYQGFDKVYFGASVPANVKKISYAASMGIIDPSEEDKTFLSSTLNSFSKLLVRERDLQELLSVIGLESEIVCDPTFLLSSKKWNAIIPQKRYRCHRYLLYYEVMQSYEARRMAVDTAKRMGLKLEIITASVHPVPQKGVNQLASPIDFLQAIRDADFVIATSFHGTAFSVIFQKQFVVTGLGKSSGRVVTLLSELGIGQQYVASQETINDYPMIDYTSLAHRMDAYVCRSKDLLNCAISH